MKREKISGNTCPSELKSKNAAFTSASDPARADFFRNADALRERHFGKKIALCAIINIRSGNCAMDCKFCSQSSRYRCNVAKYPLLPDAELLARIKALCVLPVRNIGLVASGASLAGAEFERFCRFVSSLDGSIRARLCASLGRLDAQQLQTLAAAGLRHYHHNLETAQSFYDSICSTQSWLERRATVTNALAAGMEVCSGCLFGLGESRAQREELARQLAEAGVRNIPMNFLIPRPGTPLARQPVLAPEEALGIIALFRQILPGATLRICGGRLQALGSRQAEMFRAGANALMTGDYLTTKGESIRHDLELIAAAGMSL